MQQRRVQRDAPRRSLSPDGDRYICRDGASLRSSFEDTPMTDLSAFPITKRWPAQRPDRLSSTPCRRRTG